MVIVLSLSEKVLPITLIQNNIQLWEVFNIKKLSTLPKTKVLLKYTK